MVVSVVVVRLWEALMWEGMKPRQREKRGWCWWAGGRNATLTWTQTRCELQTHFSWCCWHSYEQLSALSPHWLKASGPAWCPLWGLAHYKPVGQMVWGHVCCTEPWTNEVSRSVQFPLHLYPLCPAGVLSPYRCNNGVAQGASVDTLWRPGLLW